MTDRSLKEMAGVRSPKFGHLAPVGRRRPADHPRRHGGGLGAITERIGVDKQRAAYQEWAAKPNAYPQT